MASVLGFYILCLICENLGVDDVKTLCRALKNTRGYDGDTIEAILRSRLNPVSYFKTAFANPRLLLSTMLSHGLVLSGSRAIRYFSPDCSENDTDWDFYISADTLCMKSAICALNECGVVWSNTGSRAVHQDHIEGFSVFKNVRHTVRLTRKTFMTAIDCVIWLGYDYMLFGHGAVRIHRKPDNVEESDTVEDPHPVRYRRIGDKNCDTVDFTPYFEPHLEPFLRLVRLVATSKQWIEFEGMSAPTKFPSIIFGKIQSGQISVPQSIEAPSPIEAMKNLPFCVYVNFNRSSSTQDQYMELEKSFQAFLNVGLGAAADFFGNYTATLPI